MPKRIDYTVGINDRASKKLGLISGRFQTLTRGIKSRVGLVGATAAVVAFGVAMKKSFEYIDEIVKTSRLIGIQGQQLQAWRLAAVDAGGTASDFTKGLQKLTRSVGDADTGLMQQARAFEALGVELRGADGELKSTEIIMDEVAEGFAGMTTSAEQATHGAAIFGRGYKSLLPLLAQGSEGLRAAEKSAKELGLVMTDEMLVAAEGATSALTRAGTAAQAGGAKAFGELAPFITDLAEGFIDLIPHAIEAGKKIGEFFDGATDVAAGLAAGFENINFSNIFESIILEVYSFVTEMQAEFTGFINGIIGGINSILPDSLKMPELDTTVYDQRLEYAKNKIMELDAFNLGFEEAAELNRSVRELRRADNQVAAKELLEKRLLTAKAERLKDEEALDASNANARLAVASGISRSLSQLAQTFGKKNKAIQIAAMVVEGWVAIQSAFANGMKVGGPALAYAQAGVAAIVTAANIAKAKSGAQPGGGGAGGGGAIAPAAQPALEPPPEISVIIQGDNFTADAIKSLVGDINDLRGAPTGQLAV